ncbi:MAG: PaaI family thioesterase [Coriobacteriia bacterium]|nr:PaaI family thioesterase [Coriobacteriia bacterium]
MSFEVPRDASLAEIQAIFAKDRYAVATTGCEILEAIDGRAVCALTLDDCHLNMNDNPMGGVIFTLADFCLGIVSNYNQPPTVSSSCTIEYLNVATTPRLIATGVVDKKGRTLGFYTVKVHDENAVLVAKMTATCARLNSGP